MYPKEAACYGAGGKESSAILGFEICKEEWVSPTSSVRDNETIRYENKL